MPHPDGALLRAWRMEVRADGVEPVLPDGCRDLILHVSADGRPHWFVSPLADGISQVHCTCGERYAGFRLHPATRIDERALLGAARRADDDPAMALHLLGEHTRIDLRIAEALAALAEARGVATACARLGVSERTLERLLRGCADARAPRFWHALARARRAARALLDTAAPLVRPAARTPARRSGVRHANYRTGLRHRRAQLHQITLRVGHVGHRLPPRHLAGFLRQRRASR